MLAVAGTLRAPRDQARGGLTREGGCCQSLEASEGQRPQGLRQHAQESEHPIVLSSEEAASALS